MNRRRMIACAGAAALALVASPCRRAAGAGARRRHPDHARRRPPQEIFGGLDLDGPEEHAEEGPAARGLPRLPALLGRDAGRAAPQAAAVLLAAGHRAGLDRGQPGARERRAAVQPPALLLSRLRRDPARPGLRRRDHLERSGAQPARDGARAAAPRAEADAGAGRDDRELGRLQRHRRAHRRRDDDQRRLRAAADRRRRRRAAQRAADARQGAVERRAPRRVHVPPRPGLPRAGAAAGAVPLVQRHRQLGARGALRSAARRLRGDRPLARAAMDVAAVAARLRRPDAHPDHHRPRPRRRRGRRLARPRREIPGGRARVDGVRVAEDDPARRMARRSGAVDQPDRGDAGVLGRRRLERRPPAAPASRSADATGSRGPAHSGEVQCERRWTSSFSSVSSPPWRRAACTTPSSAQSR